MKRVMIAGALSTVFVLIGSPVVPTTATGPGGAGRIAFSRQTGSGGANLFVARPDGSGARQVRLPELLEDFGYARWSPDGRRLLITNLLRFDAAGELLPFRPATVNPDGSGFQRLEPPGAPPDMFCAGWSPDGRRLLCGFGGDTPGVFSIRSADGGDPVRLTTNPYGAGDVAGDFSPDGRRIAFVRFRGEQTALFVADTNGRHLRQLTQYGFSQGHELASARWSPDGRTIVFATDDGRVFLASSDRAGLVAVRLPTGFAFAPGWSPDGTKIVLALSVGAQEDIYTVWRDGTHLVQVTNTPDIEPAADWGRGRF